MDRWEREELIRQNEERQAELQTDIAEREQRQLAGLEPIYDNAPVDMVRRSAPAMVFKTKDDALLLPNDRVMVGVSDELKSYHEKLMMMFDAERDDVTATLQELADAVVALRADLEAVKSAELDEHIVEVPQFPLRKYNAA